MNRSQLIPALHKAGDTTTLHSINAWSELTGKALVADNDNHAEPARPVNKPATPEGTIVETLMETMEAEDLIAMYEEDEKAKKDPTFEKKLPRTAWPCTSNGSAALVRPRLRLPKLIPKRSRTSWSGVSTRADSGSKWAGTLKFSMRF
ncbi:hypothetical protein ACTGJ9_025740 [Bradyrhizobium sp. RDM12]